MRTSIDFPQTTKILEFIGSSIALVVTVDLQDDTVSEAA